MYTVRCGMLRMHRTAETLKASGFLRELIDDDDGIGGEFELPEWCAPVLETAFEFCRTGTLAHCPDLLLLLRVADYLDIRPLVDILVESIGRSLRFCTEKDVCRTFRLPELTRRDRKRARSAVAELGDTT